MQCSNGSGVVTVLIIIAMSPAYNFTSHESAVYFLSWISFPRDVSREYGLKTICRACKIHYVSVFSLFWIRWNYTYFRHCNIRFQEQKKIARFFALGFFYFIFLFIKIGVSPVVCKCCSFSFLFLLLLLLIFIFCSEIQRSVLSQRDGYSVVMVLAC